MAKMVGYACSIKLQWLNQAVLMLGENLSKEEYKAKLNEYLAFEIDSPTRLRKTREILMNVWYYDSNENTSFRREALNLVRRFPEYAPAIHLCLIFLAYPVVSDICKFMGHLFDYQDEITNSVLNQKLYDEWGERSTLQTTCRRVTLTLKDMGILDNETRRRYRLNKLKIIEPDVADFMIRVAMKVSGAGYYSFNSLTDFDLLFPFEYTVTKQQLIEDDKLTTGFFDGEFSVVLNV